VEGLSVTQTLDAANLPAGTRLGTYEIAYPLGTVRGYHCYAARAVAAGGFGSPVLLKCLPRTAERAMRFDEANVSARLRHPGIARFHHGGCEGELTYLVEELVQGAPLARVLEGGALPPPALLALAQGMLAPLQYAHEWTSDRGLPLPFLHRGLSLETVLVTAKGKVVLVDFEGMRPARDVGADTDLLDFEGMAELAPEQLRGSMIDRRVDVFSAGRLLYQAATGASPYGARRGLALVKAVLKEAPDSPRTIDPAFDPLLEEVLLRAMQRLPADRYATAADFAAALARVGAERGIAADPRALGQRAAPTPAGFARERS
jgi:eukaryotic-like serine/threonine-protein kinase